MGQRTTFQLPVWLRGRLRLVHIGQRCGGRATPGDHLQRLRPAYHSRHPLEVHEVRRRGPLLLVLFRRAPSPHTLVLPHRYARESLRQSGQAVRVHSRRSARHLPARKGFYLQYSIFSSLILSFQSFVTPVYYRSAFTILSAYDNICFRVALFTFNFLTLEHIHSASIIINLNTY